MIKSLKYADNILIGLYDDAGLPQLEGCLGKFPKLKILGHGPAFWSEIGQLETPADRGTYPKYPIKDEGVVPKLFRREEDIHLADRMVSTVLGARRAGKSFRVLQFGDELIRSGKLPSARAICSLDFDNPVLAGMSAADLLCIQRVFLKVTPEFDLKSPLLFILDEIHKIPGWSCAAFR